jgi:polyisoprenyl-phosphate glycosyltransferase
LKYSVVIPVYNSETTLTEVVERTIRLFDTRKESVEILLVDDGSKDHSWKVICSLCDRDSRILGIHLLKNYGQHNANFCGFRKASGDYIITLDDDLQNPPEEIGKLIDAAKKGHDLVIGQFAQKKHHWYRRLGSVIVNWLIAKVFNKPKGLVLTNFRIIQRSIIQRVVKFRGTDPYVPGLVISAAENPTNVKVNHHQRARGRSSYNFSKISTLVVSLLFNYSAYPLRVLTLMGFAVSLVSFSIGSFILIRALTKDIHVSGWASIIVLVSMLSGFIVLLLGALGEYLIHITRGFNWKTPYNVIREYRRKD